MAELIDLLVERQRTMGESDREFAGRLGLSRQNWQALRTRKHRLGLRSLQGIARAFPDLADKVQDVFRPAMPGK